MTALLMPQLSRSTSAGRRGRGADVVVVGPGSTGVGAMLSGAGPVRTVRAAPSPAAALDAPVDLVVLTGPVQVFDVRRLSGLAPVLLVVPAAEAPAALVAAVRAGAVGVLVDGEFTRAELCQAGIATLAGQSHLSPSAATALVSQLRTPRVPGARPATARLTRRERQIMEQVAAGHPNADIARVLGLAEQTVRNQISAIYRRLGVRDRAQAIVLWLHAPLD